MGVGHRALGAQSGGGGRRSGAWGTTGSPWGPQRQWPLGMCQTHTWGPAQTCRVRNADLCSHSPARHGGRCPRGPGEAGRRGPDPGGSARWDLATRRGCQAESRPRKPSPRTLGGTFGGVAWHSDGTLGCEVKDLEVATTPAYPGSATEGGRVGGQGRPVCWPRGGAKACEPPRGRGRGKEAASPWGLREGPVLPNLDLSPKPCRTSRLISP